MLSSAVINQHDAKGRVGECQDAGLLNAGVLITKKNCNQIDYSSIISRLRVLVK
jgi:hypothetical protein